MKHDTACFILTLLYVKFHHKLYINYMQTACDLFEWLQNEELDETVVAAWPNKPGADICCSCGKVYGVTIGARIRFGCPACQNCRDATISGYAIQQLCKIMHISYPLCEYLLAHALLCEQAFKERQLAASSTTPPESQQHSSTAEMPTQVSTH